MIRVKDANMTLATSEEAFIHRELGKITALLGVLTKDIEDFRSDSKEHRSEVSASLAAMNSTIGEIQTKVNSVESLASSSSDTISGEVMPMVTKLRVWEQRGIGFLAFAGIAGTSLGVAVTKYATELTALWGSFWK